MTVPVIALNVRPWQYSALVDLANRVVASLTDNVNFATPAVSLVEMEAQITQVVNGIALWGPKNNRGSRADLANLKNQAVTLYSFLKSEAAYVQLTAAMEAGNDYFAMAEIILTSGFGLKASKHHQGVLNKVQNFRFMPSDALNRNQVKMVWDRPLEVTSPNNLKSSDVYMSTTTNFADAVHLGTTSKNEWIYTNVGALSTLTFFVVPIGAAGEGGVSDPITVTLIPA